MSHSSHAVPESHPGCFVLCGAIEQHGHSVPQDGVNQVVVRCDILVRVPLAHAHANLEEVVPCRRQRVEAVSTAKKDICLCNVSGCA
jgi:hypothetical protein